VYLWYLNKPERVPKKAVSIPSSTLREHGNIQKSRHRKSEVEQTKHNNN